MGCAKSKPAAADTGLAAALAARRAAASESKIPTMEYYDPKPMWMSTACREGSVFRNGVGTTFKKWPHKMTFIPVCRVTGETTRRSYEWLLPKQCEHWVPRGDLLVAEARKIVAAQGFTGTGKEKLAQVYAYLDAQDVGVVYTPAGDEGDEGDGDENSENSGGSGDDDDAAALSAQVADLDAQIAAAHKKSGGKPKKADRPPATDGADAGDAVDADAPMEEPPLRDAGPLKGGAPGGRRNVLYVKTLRGATLEVGLPPLHPRGPRARHATVGDVRRWVAAREGVAAADARLIFAGRDLTDDATTLEDTLIEYESAWHLVMRMGRTAAAAATPATAEANPPAPPAAAAAAAAAAGGDEDGDGDGGAASFGAAVDAAAEAAFRAATGRYRAIGNPGPYWISLAGAPGSGKSTVAAAIARRVNAFFRDAGPDANADAACVVVPMDGFQYSKAELRALAGGDAAKEAALFARRGAPHTFDARALVDALVRVKRAAQAAQAAAPSDRGVERLPGFDHAEGDPVPGGVTVPLSAKVVIVEGNYVMLYGTQPWDELRDVFDARWYLACPRGEARARIARRHVAAWGITQEAAEARADANDVPNGDLVREGARELADRVIESTPLDAAVLGAIEKARGW